MARPLIDAALAAYGFFWKAALPVLRCNHRLRQGWAQRTLNDGMPAPADLWIQAASGGEAYLAWEVLKGLKSPYNRSLRIIVTTYTKQGMEILERAADEIHRTQQGLAIQPWYFPFDAPDIMNRMVSHVRPSVALILETEIWPGFLSACKRYGVKVLLANGRMTAKSLGGYMTWPGLFRAIGPDRVMAVSETDGRRFSTLFGQDNVWVMPNIKFDRMATAGPMPRKSNPLRNVIPEDADFVVFGSVRKQEIQEVEQLASGLMRKRPKTILGLFPRHMHHVKLWQKAMNMAGLNWTLRSKLAGAAQPGTVIIWDTFGELVPAYGLAKCAFVGGSLAPLGGQNFLEPMTCGATPVIGPHWKNFAWVGREVFDAGLAVEAANWQAALDALCAILADTPDRTDVAAKAKTYIADRRGGAKSVCKQVADFLNND